MLAALGLGIGALAPCVPAYASYYPNVPLDDMLAASAAVVVGTVTDIDSRNPGKAEPMTRVSIAVQDVLHGKVSVGSHITLVFRGGELPDGDFEKWDSHPDLEVGETYSFFIVAEYFISPLLPAAGSLLKVSTAAGKQVLTDPVGNGIVVSAQQGILPVRASPVTRPQPQILSGGAQTAATTPVPEQAATNAANFSSYDEFRDLVRSRVTSKNLVAIDIPSGPKRFP